jgi:hypothetical protein
MTAWTAVVAAAALLLAQPAPKKAAPAPAAGDLPVTVTYKGKGPVDATHRIIVWTFADSNITSASRPIDHLYVTKSGETVTFKGVSGPVYLFAAYVEKGDYDGVGAPPPPGLPCATYRKVAKGEPTAVKPGAPVAFTFDDSERWNK